MNREELMTISAAPRQYASARPRRAAKTRSRTAILRIPADAWFLKGHFPGNPIVPGVMLCAKFWRSPSACCCRSEHAGRSRRPCTPDSITSASNPRSVRAIRSRLAAVSPGPKSPFYLCRGQRLSWETRSAIKAEFSFALDGAISMFSKILIANRGEIAVRIIRACKEMGIASVAVCSEADRDCLHVGAGRRMHLHRPRRCQRTATSEPRAGSSAPPSLSGAQAIHPGYGFLSENAQFAEACRKNGIAFIGPDST